MSIIYNIYVLHTHAYAFLVPRAFKDLWEKVLVAQ